MADTIRFPGLALGRCDSCDLISRNGVSSLKGYLKTNDVSGACVSRRRQNRARSSRVSSAYPLRRLP